MLRYRSSFTYGLLVNNLHLTDVCVLGHFRTALAVLGHVTFAVTGYYFHLTRRNPETYTLLFFQLSWLSAVCCSASVASTIEILLAETNLENEAKEYLTTNLDIHCMELLCLLCAGWYIGKKISNNGQSTDSASPSELEPDKEPNLKRPLP
ncbi:hypothetical protein HOLleu_22053 [Holothuria leucospilota]|uniref:Uncharacterized protein n=1 Tax=Holothuria leucospilota TaxID=206669 RepID=A0A9Q1BY12_HOLLE|nr:hypothetical protein HOLleu_22053 [Holothuria leucospilota]